jgi:hypothetical protein
MVSIAFCLSFGMILSDQRSPFLYDRGKQGELIDETGIPDHDTTPDLVGEIGVPAGLVGLAVERAAVRQGADFDGFGLIHDYAILRFRSDRSTALASSHYQLKGFALSSLDAFLMRSIFH